MAENLMESYMVTRRLEMPSLSLKNMAEGDSVIVRFAETFETRKIGKKGQETPADIVNVIDLADGIEKSLVMPFIIKKNFQELKGNVVRITKGKKSGQCRLYALDVLALKKEKK